MSNEQIRARVRERGITRLCHVTRSMSLPLIIQRAEVAATSRLTENERAIYYPNDQGRLDGHKTHVSCSIQYPNAWYLRAVSTRYPQFPDWVVLILDPEPLWWEGTLFCPVNAATAGGRYVGAGTEAFDLLFEAATPTGRFSRRPNHLASCPTDNQAEVLVPRGISLDRARCVVLPDPAQAERERWRLQRMGISPCDLGIAVCADFFDPHILAGRIASGESTDPGCEPW